MAYCVYTDVIGTGGILLNIGTTAIGTSMVASYITKAENIINSKLNDLGAPFTITPPVVKTICVDISGYFVMRSLYTQDSQNKSEWTEKLYDKAIELLDDIADGEVDLLDSSGDVIVFTGKGGDVESNTMDYVPTFDEGDTLEQKVSDGKLDAIEDDKDADN